MDEYERAKALGHIVGKQFTLRKPTVLKGPPPARVARVIGKFDNYVMFYDDAFFMYQKNLVQKQARQLRIDVFSLDEQLLSDEDYYEFQRCIAKARKAGVRL